MAAEVQSAENCYGGGDNQFKAMQMCWPNFDHFYGSGGPYPSSHNTSVASDSTVIPDTLFRQCPPTLGSGPTQHFHELPILASIAFFFSEFVVFQEEEAEADPGRAKRRGKYCFIESKSTLQAYYARRHRNNESAKKSREMRRKKEDEREHTMKLLELENQRLRIEIEGLKQNLLHLQQVHYQAQAQLQSTQLS
ncbi:hypothetical protein L596_005415 [Steinernema carpocapsae]|uniref:BZIP domain-containing protein n=1 Tax=Steinernema carpocapsae TaxID=34508 RepID=A0A4U8UYY7_STECR|nr:hypothetical protein L596_005415 [Steinernema carpocapsae]